MRIIVTGSRTWDDERTIRLALAEYNHLNPTLVHGACPRGADAIANQWAVENGWTIEEHSAEWDRHGKRAGFLRNREMADLGADVCLAFHRDNSRGTQHMVNQCERVGIPVVEFIYLTRKGTRGGWGG